MAKRAVNSNRDEINIDFGKLNPKQVELFNSKAKFTCFGGAKSGGKSHGARVLGNTYALSYDGIRILFLRATFEDIRQNQIEPNLKILPPEVISYNGSTHQMTFYNGSTIQYGNWEGTESERKYQGQEFDIIIIDEATQFTERMFRHLAGCLRGNVGKNFPKRMYLTCNPGGVGHFWVKRLFIDRKFKVDYEHPEKSENPADYNFIFSMAEDNVEMLKENPAYLEDISKMAESDAMRYGNWDIMGGNYFTNFDENIHVRKPFRIPSHWQMYRSFDYGLDMFACFWWAVDEDGRSWCFRSFEGENLNIQDAAKAALTNTLPGENILVTYAPPDMWSRQKETGRTIKDVFSECGLPIIKADNNRVQGHMLVRSLLDPIPLNDPWVKKMYGEHCPKTLPALMFFDNVGQVLEDIQSIQADETNPSDCAKEPHDVTHTIDGIRYYAVNRTLKAEVITEKKTPDPYIDDYIGDDYESYITGGEITDSYMNY